MWARCWKEKEGSGVFFFFCTRKVSDGRTGREAREAFCCAIVVVVGRHRLKRKKKKRTVDLAEHPEHRLGVRVVEEPDRRVSLILLKGN